MLSLVNGLHYRWTDPITAAEGPTPACGQFPPLVSRLLAARGVTTPEAAERFLNPKLTHLRDPGLIPNIAVAARRLVEAIRGRQQVVIYGDYDVDGVTATAILFHILRCADGDADVRSYVPHRVEEGYGLNLEAMEALATQGANLIVSVDCGVRAFQSAGRAKELGVDLIITDHHALPQPGEGFPEALAIVHPGLPGSEYGFDGLCGAAVAFKLAWAFAVQWCGSERVSEAFRHMLIECLPLVALGTIADVVPLVDENRVLARLGLQRIRQSQFAGVQALIDAADLRGERIDSYQVGFVLGPRLNACGRMGHAGEAVELMTTASETRAAEIASSLNRFNRQRQQTERRILTKAMALAEESGLLADDNRIIALAHEDWHSGVVGIVCSRLVERFGRPTILMGREGDICTGSARSVAGFSICQALASCDDLLISHGGHDMAAGLRCHIENLPALQERLRAHALEHLDPELMTPEIAVDCDADLGELSLHTVRLIEEMSPFGRGNPAARLRLRELTIANPPETIGRHNKHLVLRVAQPGVRQMLRLIGFGFGEHLPRFTSGQRIDAIVEPKINAWNGRESVEAKIVDLSLEGVAAGVQP